MSAKKKFVWGNQEYSLREFVSELSRNLPLVVRVCQGYCSHDGQTYTFGADEEYRISHLKEQLRVIVDDNLGRRLSIPEEYPIRFHLLQHGKVTSSTPVLLQKIIRTLSPGMVIQPESKSRLQVWIGADKTLKTDIKTLEVVDVYHDRYLLGSPVTDGVLNRRQVVIPLFVNIKLAIAEGLLIGTLQDFYKVLSDLNKTAQKNGNGDIPGNPEIMLYEENHALPPSEYAYLEPKTYISCLKASSLPHDLSPPEDLTPNPLSGQKARKPPPIAAKPKPSRRTDKPLPPLPCDYEQPPFQDTVISHQPINMKNFTEEIRQVKLKPTMRQALPGYSAGSPVHEFADERFDPSSTKQRDSMEPERHSKIYNEIPPSYQNGSEGQTTCEKDADSQGFTSAADVPANIKEISIKQVANVLRLLHMNKYVETFVESDIDGELLVALDINILRNDFGLSQFEATKLYKFVHGGWRPKPE